MAECGSPDSEILFVIGPLSLGGAERHLSMIAPALKRRGWKPSIYCLKGGGPLEPELRANGITITAPPDRRQSGSPWSRGLWLVTTFWHLFRFLRREKPAIVHFFLPAAYLIGAPAAILAGIPMRVMSRRSLNVYQRKYPFGQAMERLLHKWMTAVLGNSESVMAELRQEGVEPRRTALIYNGIDAESFAQIRTRVVIRQELGIGDDALVLGITANLIPYKGHQDLLDALGQAAADLPADWRLLVIGRDDGIGDDLRRSAIALGIGGNVLFLGPRRDVPALFQACDIGLLCSHQEGFANAILEGMAASLPMIVTDVGGNAEAVLDGETGLVVPPHQPARLAEAIVRLARDASLRTRFGRAGRRRVEEHFTLAGCVARYATLYRTLLAGKLPQDVPSAELAEESQDYSRQRRMFEG